MITITSLDISNKYIGKKVICRSNENDPLMVGIFGGRNTAYNNVPMVESDGSPFFIGGIIIPYSELMFEMLNKLTPKKQYKLLSELVLTIKEL